MRVIVAMILAMLLMIAPVAGQTPTRTPKASPSPTPRPTSTAVATPTPSPGGNTVRLTTDKQVPCDTGVAGPDVSGQINTVISALPNDITVVIECRYKIDLPVIVKGKQKFRFVLPVGFAPGQAGFVRYAQGQKPSTWPHAQPFYSYVHFEDLTDLFVDGIVIAGPLATRSYDALLESAHAMEFFAVRGALVKRVSISGVHGDVAYFGKGMPKNQDIVLIDTSGRINGRQGVGIIYVTRLTMQRVILQLSARTCLDIEPLSSLGPGAVSDLLFEDSSCLDYVNFGFGTHEITTYRVTLRRATFRGGLGLGKYMAGVPAHDGLTMEDVIYTFDSARSRSAFEIQPGTTGIAILRANWRFRGARSAGLQGTGTVRDSIFSNEQGLVGACLGPNMVGTNNTGTVSCP